jgi:transposase-like protein
MKRAKQQGKKVRKQYTEEYKREGLARADRVGIAAAAGQLGVHESQLYGWRAKVRREQDQGSLAVDVFLAAASSRVFPLTVPLVTTGGSKRVLNLPDAASFIAIVLSGAVVFYTIGLAMRVLWSKF